MVIFVFIFVAMDMKTLYIIYGLCRTPCNMASLPNCGKPVYFGEHVSNSVNVVLSLSTVSLSTVVLNSRDW